MDIEQLGLIVGVVVSVALALVPWMFMVHAKLAVVASQIARLTLTVDRLAEGERLRGSRCATHHAATEQLRRRLDKLEAQMVRVTQSLREYEE